MFVAPIDATPRRRYHDGTIARATASESFAFQRQGHQISRNLRRWTNRLTLAPLVLEVTTTENAPGKCVSMSES